MRDMRESLGKKAHLHYSLGQRLVEMAAEAYSHYEYSRRFKKEEIKRLIEHSETELELARDSRDPRTLASCQQIVCRRLFDGLDNYVVEEAARLCKYQHSASAYFSLQLKAFEKEVAVQKLYCQPKSLDLDVYNFQQIEQMIIDMHNTYGGLPLQSKIRVVPKPNLRQSLELARVHQQLVTKQKGVRTKITDTLTRLESSLSQLHLDTTAIAGLLDPQKLGDTRSLARQINSTLLRSISFDMLCTYSSHTSKPKRSLLEGVRKRFKGENLGLASNWGEFITLTKSKGEEYRQQVALMLFFSRVYCGEVKAREVRQAMQMLQEVNAPPKMHPYVGVAVVDYVLDTTFNDVFLNDNFLDLFKLVVDFGQTFCGLEQALILVVFVRKLVRRMQCTPLKDHAPIQELLSVRTKFNDGLQLEMGQKIGAEVQRMLMKLMLTFFIDKIALSNPIKVSLVLQQVLTVNKFDALDFVNASLRYSGYQLLKQNESVSKLLNIAEVKGQVVLRYLVESLQNAGMQQINSELLDGTAKEVCVLLNVSREGCAMRLKNEFGNALRESVKGCLQLVAAQEGVDREGYVLRLGVCLGGLGFQEDLYFEVLDRYFTATAVDYHQLLAHSRDAELWVVEDNCQATSSCIDFCNTLYKPFEFLLTSLHQLDAKIPKTNFIRQFSSRIRLRLNAVLKAEINYYLRFLYDSLAHLNTPPPQAAFKSQRGCELVKATPLDSRFAVAKQIVRRLWNMLFVKEQLKDIMGEFLQPIVSKYLNEGGHSIWDQTRLKQAAELQPGSKQILQNWGSIAATVDETQDKLIQRVATASASQLLDCFFANLYFQSSKNALEQFFSSQSDYRLSEHTLLKNKSQLQQVFALVTKLPPREYGDRFARAFLRRWFLYWRAEVLNANKFKLPLIRDEVQKYLDQDATYVINMLKQLYLAEEVVQAEIARAVDDLRRDLARPTLKLVDAFNQASLRHDKSKCHYLLLILNLRINDSKAEDFVKKFKHLAL